MPSISASNFPADKVNIHKRLLSIIGRNTKAIDTITKIPSPDLSKFTLPCTVLYASESAEPTIGINEFKVNRTARVETSSTEVVIICLKESTAVNTVITNPSTHFTAFEIIEVIPVSFDSEHTLAVTDTLIQTSRIDRL